MEPSGLPPPPFVTVAIATYQRAALLRQALATIVQQDYPRDRLEILVIDNGPGPETAEVVAEFADANPPPRLVREPRQGVAWARNRAVHEARHEILAFADDDILAPPDWLRRLVEPFRHDPGQRIGAIGGEVVPVFPDGPRTWVAQGHAPLGFRKDPGPLLPRQSPMSANLALRRAIFERTGLFLTGLGRRGEQSLVGEESELLRRVRAVGYEVWFAPDAVVRHQLPASRLTYASARRNAHGSARSRVIERAGQPGFAWFCLTRAVANAAKAAWFGLLAGGCWLLRRRESWEKAAVRAVRAMGYLEEIGRQVFAPRE